MTPQALSRITWTTDDRRAWLAAYADARRVARVRARRERTEVERHSVHVDVLQARADAISLADRAEDYNAGIDDDAEYNAILTARESAREIEEAFRGTL